MTKKQMNDAAIARERSWAEKEAAPVAEPKRDFIADPIIGQALLDQALVTIEETARQRDELQSQRDEMRKCYDEMRENFNALLCTTGEEKAALTKQRDELLAACQKAAKMLDNPDAEYATPESTSEFLTACAACLPAEKGDA